MIKKKYAEHLLLLLLAFLPISANAYNDVDTVYDFEADGLYFAITDSIEKEVEITYAHTLQQVDWFLTGGDPTYSGDVVIPSSVSYGNITYAVTSIGNYAFALCDSLTSIEIPSSVTTIGDFAFSKSGLTNIDIPSSVTTIGSNAFSVSELTNINIPSSVTSIGKGAFYSSNLTSIDIPSSITTIKSYTFYNCKRLTSVNIPSSVTTIDVDAFSNCTSLTNVTLPEGLTSLSGFYYCTSLTSIDIPSSVTTIGSYAFYGCTGLTSIDIPSSVTTIDSRAFRECSSLTSLTVPVSASYTTYCSSITQCPFENEILIDLTITGKGDMMNYAFYNAQALENVTINDGVTSIGMEAFYYCKSLTSIEIPSSVTSIYYNAFLNCTKLENINVSSENKSYASVDGVLYSAAIDTLVCCPAGKETISIPSSVTTIGSYAFAYLNESTSIEIPYSVASVGSCAFYKYSGTIYVRVSPTLNFRSSLSGCYADIYAYKSQKDKIEKTYTNGNVYDLVTFKIRQTQSSSTSFVCKVNATHKLGDSIVIDSIYSSLDSINNVSLEYDSIYVGGLDPDSTYNISVYARLILEDGNILETYSGSCELTTSQLTLTTEQPKVLSSTSAQISATTNIDENETSVGFEWRKMDAPDEVASKSAAAEIYDGELSGVIKGLNESTYYKYRAYYTSASDSTYYSDWVGIDTDDYSYFEPTVKTGDVEVSDSYVTAKGYALQGTEDIEDQGFEYWVSGSSAKSSRVSSKASDDGVTRVTVDGQKMTATLTDLLAGTTYEIRAYATTASGTTYGETVQFTTAETTGISSVTIDGSDGLELFVRQGDGVQIAVSGGDKSECAYRIYSMTGAAVASGKVAADGNWHSVADASVLKGVYVIIATNGSETKTKKLYVK